MRRGGWRGPIARGAAGAGVTIAIGSSRSHSRSSSRSRSLLRFQWAPLLPVFLLLLRPLTAAAAISMGRRGPVRPAVLRALLRPSHHPHGAAAFMLPSSALSSTAAGWGQQGRRQTRRLPRSPPSQLQHWTGGRPRQFTTVISTEASPAAAAEPAAAHAHAPATAAAPPPPPPTAREQAHLAVSGFFPVDTKDNSTAFFHVPPFPPPPPPGDPVTAAAAVSWPEAVAAALRLPLARAEKLHAIGAVYAKRGGKFRRTRNVVEGGMDHGRFPPEAPVEGELVRVHLFPRWARRWFGVGWGGVGGGAPTNAEPLLRSTRLLCYAVLNLHTHARYPLHTLQALPPLLRHGLPPARRVRGRGPAGAGEASRVPLLPPRIQRPRGGSARRPDGRGWRRGSIHSTITRANTRS